MINHSATMSHSGMTREGRAAIGIHDATLRISIGVENADDIIKDLERGLACL
jgi:cystathionine beta-lyase/cystathionine gamma-synthase